MVRAGDALLEEYMARHAVSDQQAESVTIDPTKSDVEGVLDWTAAAIDLRGLSSVFVTAMGYLEVQQNI